LTTSGDFKRQVEIPRGAGRSTDRGRCLLMALSGSRDRTDICPQMARHRTWQASGQCDRVTSDNL